MKLFFQISFLLNFLFSSYIENTENTSFYLFKSFLNLTFLFHYLKYFKIIPLFQLQENNTTQAYSKKVISKKKKKFCFKSIYTFSNVSPNSNSCPPPTTGQETVSLKSSLRTTFLLHPAPQKLWKNFGIGMQGHEGIEWKKEGRRTRAQGPCIAWRMEQKWRKPAQQRRKGRKSKKRPEGLLAECGLEKWGHVFSVKLLESLARSSASSCFARSAFTRSQRSFNWLAWIYRKVIFRLIFRFLDTNLFIFFVFIISRKKKIQAFFVHKRRI